MVIIDSLTYALVASASDSNGDFQANKVQNERAGGVNFFQNVAPLMIYLSEFAKQHDAAVIVITHSDEAARPTRDELVSPCCVTSSLAPSTCKYTRTHTGPFAIPTLQEHGQDQGKPSHYICFSARPWDVQAR